MNILLIVFIGLICGLIALMIKKYTSPSSQISAYLKRSAQIPAVDMLMGVLGAFIGRFMTYTASTFGTQGIDINMFNFAFAFCGAFLLIWIGRNISWLHVM